MFLEAASALLQQAEVDLAGLVVDGDLAVEHRSAPSQRRGEHVGQLSELGGEVETVAARQHRRSVGRDPHRGTVAIQFVLVRPLGPFSQTTTVGPGEHWVDPGGNGVVCHGDLRSWCVACSPGI